MAFLFYSLFPLSFLKILSEMLKVSLVLVWEVSNSTWSKNRSFCVLSLERWNLRRPACLSNLTVRSILPYCKCPHRQQKNKRIEELIKLSILELRWVFCVCFARGFASQATYSLPDVIGEASQVNECVTSVFPQRKPLKLFKKSYPYWIYKSHEYLLLPAFSCNLNCLFGSDLC